MNKLVLLIIVTAVAVLIGVAWQRTAHTTAAKINWQGDFLSAESNNVVAVRDIQIGLRSDGVIVWRKK